MIVVRSFCHFLSSFLSGHVAAGRVSHALASSLDIFPTLVSLGKGHMPPNRKYDGVDLTDVLLNGNDSAGHQVLFHPNSGAGKQIGNLTAMRIGQFKIFFETAPAGDCNSPKGKQSFHDPPLIFDLANDIAEANPLPPTHPQYETIVLESRSFLMGINDDIAKDNTTVADYSGSTADEPCCDRQHVCCRCNN